MVTETPITPDQVATKEAFLNRFATQYPKIKEGAVAAHRFDYPQMRQVVSTIPRSRARATFSFNWMAATSACTTPLTTHRPVL
jgi:hypothetical protein